MRSLASFVLKHGPVADKPIAALMHIYHAAIHNRHSEAKELMLASRLHDDMRERDEACQILFNRCMAQIAMAFFRAGFIQDAHTILANIFQRRAVVRELLAQGSSQKYGKVDFEREKAEKRRRVPAHMFINVDQLEACHLVCSMLLEVPVLAACQYDSKPRTRLSQQYYKLMEERDRMIIIGPPEATDDCVRVGVMQASQYLNEGDWKQCLAVLLSFNVWNLWPAGYSSALAVMLADKVKEAALEVFLYTRGPHYSSLSREYLASLFELSDARIRSFVSTFVVNKEFAGCWDDATGTLIIHDTVPTKVQGITADLVEKLGYVLDIVERNERCVLVMTNYSMLASNSCCVCVPMFVGIVSLAATTLGLASVSGKAHHQARPAVASCLRAPVRASSSSRRVLHNLSPRRKARTIRTTGPTKPARQVVGLGHSARACTRFQSLHQMHLLPRQTCSVVLQKAGLNSAQRGGCEGRQRRTLSLGLLQSQSRKAAQPASAAAAWFVARAQKTQPARSSSDNRTKKAAYCTLQARTVTGKSLKFGRPPITPS